MRLTWQNGVIGLAAETAEEAAACAALADRSGHVFRLSAGSGRGVALADLGPEAEACRAPVNITRSVESTFAAISNLARTPFEIDGETYASVEAFWQAIKFPDPARRKAIARLHGPEAKDAGRAAGRPAVIDYGGRSVAVGGPDHWALMEAACRAKFTQHAGARAALLATGRRPLTHRVRQDSRTIPGAIMAEIWMRIRAELGGQGPE
ncbi:MAG: NADAR family protein [Rhodospirillaceae bacterium]